MAEETTVEVKDREQFRGLMREAVVDLVRDEPAVIVAALQSDKAALRAALDAAGIIVSGPASPDAATVVAAYRNAQDEGRVIRGFGARYRSATPSRASRAPDGSESRNFLFGEVAVMAEAWFRALYTRDGVDRVTGKNIRQITEEMNRATRAPATPMTDETGTGGGYLVPTAVAAQIFQEMNERFVLRDLVEVFVSATPLDIPRRISQVTVSRGAPATDLTELNLAATLGKVKLSPERVGAITYIDPRLALAAAVGPVQWVIGQLAEAIAKDYQRCIIAGDRTIREPVGINTLPTAGGNLYDRAKTATWVDTDNQTRRDSFRKLMFAIAQAHRESARFTWVANNDAVQRMLSTNDLNQQPFRDAEGGRPMTYYGKQVVESTALATSGTTTVIAGDFSQYAWLETPDGLRIDQTTEGGAAWVSDTIGVKIVQSVDGAPVIPQAFGILPSVVI